MKIMVSREVRIVDAFKVFLDTIAIYQNAVRSGLWMHSRYF